MEDCTKATSLYKGLISATAGTLENHQAGKSISCEDLALPSTISSADEQATLAFARTIAKESDSHHIW
jgi:hypothetical protein